MSGSARLNLPFLSAGQAQKEFFHNEALQMLDLLVAAAVEEGPRSNPPASPVVGACYIVGASPSGGWVGKDGCIAGFTSGGWRFIPATEGMIAFVKSAEVWAGYRSGAWELGIVRGASLVLDGNQVVGSQLAAIAGPSGGTVVDTESRTAINQILAALRQHGLIDS
jgi:Protein of unknown function (DUF2793)